MMLINCRKSAVKATAPIIASLAIGFGYAFSSDVAIASTAPVQIGQPLDAALAMEPKVGAKPSSDGRNQVASVTPAPAFNQRLAEDPAKLLSPKKPVNATPNANAVSRAAKGKRDNKIFIGQSAEFSGEGTARENTLGASAYFDYVNKRGGVHGKKIELLSLDDARDKQKAIDNTKKLVKEENVLALFGYRSTPIVEAVAPLTKEFEVPLVAPFTGAESLRTPFNPWMFHVRASYRTEGAKIIELLTSLGLKKIAILHQTDSFGKDGLAGYQDALKNKKLEPIVVASYDRKTLDISAALKATLAAEPQAVVMACTPSACAKFVKEVRNAGQYPQFMTLSNTNSDEFLKTLGDEGRGVGISQVMPYPWNTGIPVVAEFQRVLRQNNSADTVPLSYATLEGFIAAKLLVEGLRRAGPNPTRVKLTTALEKMRRHDLGGITVDYSPDDHMGTQFVELTVVSKAGRLVR